MNNSPDLEAITFYDVHLVWGAAPSIGCGSRAKPLLTDLERQTPIREAWLNRTGTIVAIVWRGSTRTDEAIQTVFERHEVEYTERLADKQIGESFGIEGSWFHGADVDRLSLEEAREIAETVVAPATKDRLVSVGEAAQIKTDIEAYFRKELVKFRTKQELLRDTQSKFLEAILNIYVRHVGTKRTAALQARGIQNPFDRARQQENSSCCS